MTRHNNVYMGAARLCAMLVAVCCAVGGSGRLSGAFITSKRRKSFSLQGLRNGHFISFCWLHMSLWKARANFLVASLLREDGELTVVEMASNLKERSPTLVQ